MLTPPILYYPGFEPDLGWLKAFLLFHDRLVRLVPPGVEDLDSPAFKRFRDCFPDSIKDEPSTEELVEFDDGTLALLDRAFSVLPPLGPRGEANLLTDSEGYIRGMDFPGYVFMHRSKLSSAVLRILEAHELTPSSHQFIYQYVAKTAGAPSDLVVINKDASHLILSLITERFAYLHGFHTVTDSRLDFSLFALERGIGPRSSFVPGRSTECLLASAIISAYVPRDMRGVPPDKYREYRKAYAEAREPLARLTQKLAGQRLNQIHNSDELAVELRVAAEDFGNTLKKVRRTQQLRSMALWLPFGITSLLQLAGPVSPDLKITLGMIGARILISGIGNVIATRLSSEEQDAARLQNALCSLRRREWTDEVAATIDQLQ